MNKDQIVEKQLRIPPDYQYRAIRSSVWPQRNWHRNKLYFMKTVLNFKKTDDVLDLGTGSGNFELSFARQVRSIVGVDYNDEALNFLKRYIARRRISNVHLFQADIRHLPNEVARRRYDKIVIMDTIEHIRIAEAQKVLPHLYRLLKKGGALFIVTPNYKSLWILIEGILDKFTAIPKLSGEQHLAKFDRQNLARVLNNSGFADLEFFSFNLFSYIFPFGFLSRLLVDMERKIVGNYGCLLAIVATKV